MSLSARGQASVTRVERPLGREQEEVWDLSLLGVVDSVGMATFPGHLVEWGAVGGFVLSSSNGLTSLFCRWL